MINLPETFTTQRLSFRKPILDDAPLIYAAYATDPDVTKYLSWRPHRSEADTTLFLSEQLSLWVDGLGYSWVMLDESSGLLIGMMDVRVNGFRAECGYVLAKRFWGRGYMTEALIATRDLVFANPGIERFQIVCDVDNPASAKVMEKAGFMKEGILRKYFRHPNIDSVPRDCLCYSFVR